MNKDLACTLLTGAGHSVIAELRLADNTGWQLSLDNGATVEVHDSGEFVVGGKDTDSVKTVLIGAILAQA